MAAMRDQIQELQRRPVDGNPPGALGPGCIAPQGGGVSSRSPHSTTGKGRFWCSPKLEHAGSSFSLFASSDSKSSDSGSPPPPWA